MAPDAATARAGHDLAGLRAAATDVARGSAPALSAAAELRARQVARTAARKLDPALLDRLPPRSRLPYLARQWDETVAELSLFLARWEVTPGGVGRWEWALGPRREGSNLDQQRRQMAADLVELTIATAAEAVRTAGGDLPTWTRPHLANQAARGTCGHDPSRLIALYARVEEYRSAAGVVEAEHSESVEEAVLGQTPADSALRIRREIGRVTASPRPRPQYRWFQTDPADDRILVEWTQPFQRAHLSDSGLMCNSPLKISAALVGGRR